ncbi:MAG: transposase [Isosphaeraceae bacterium]
MIIPDEARPIIQAIAPSFSRPTLRRFVLLMGAALLCTGRRTVANLLRVAAPLASGHITSYQRVFSSAAWSTIRLACGLCRLVVALLPPDRPIVLAGDDTVDGHPGKRVYGKARHRDPVRSSHGYTAWRYGHKWVVLAVLVRFPFAARPWALPVLVALYRSEQDNQTRRRPHRTPAQIMCQLLRVMRLWFPDRRLIFVGDAGYGTHEVARFCDRHRLGLTLVSKLHPEANLFEPPPPYSGKGRPRVKGAARPKPRQAVAEARRLRRRTVAWYGGGTRRVGLLSQTGHWYKSGAGLVPLRWVFVRDRDGTHRDEFFFSTDPTLSPTQIIELYCGRWNIETTFQELRAWLGLETTRGWCRRTVLRMAPCLFGLYTVVALLYQSLPESKRSGRVEWPGKSAVTFSDALMAVRRWLWREWIFPQIGLTSAVEKLPEPVQDLLLYGLAPAA